MGEFTIPYYPFKILKSPETIPDFPGSLDVVGIIEPIFLHSFSNIDDVVQT